MKSTIEKFVANLVLILAIVQSTNGIKSSVCPDCEDHYLSCPSGQQIDISSAYHGFTQTNKTCTNTDCRTECCEYFKNDCLQHYYGEESGPLMRCCGQRSCILKGSVDTIGYCSTFPQSLQTTSTYSEINYRCLAESPIDTSIHSDWQYARSLQLVIDGMNPFYCTYNVRSIYYNFFQTNTNGTNFRIDDNIDTRSNIHYAISGSTTFQTQPYSDIYIVISGYARLHITNSLQTVVIRYRCNNESTIDSIPIESTTSASAKVTTTVGVTKVSENTEDFLKEETTRQTRENKLMESTTSASAKVTTTVGVTKVSENPETNRHTRENKLMESTTSASAEVTNTVGVNEVYENPEDFLKEETNLQTRENKLIGHEDNQSLIVGSTVGAVGGLILLLIIVALVIVLLKRRKRKNYGNGESEIRGHENPGYNLGPDPFSVASGSVNITNDNSVNYQPDDVTFEPLPELRVTDHTYDNHATISVPNSSESDHTYENHATISVPNSSESDHTYENHATISVPNSSKSGAQNK